MTDAADRLCASFCRFWRAAHVAKRGWRGSRRAAVARFKTLAAIRHAQTSGASADESSTR